MRIPNNWDTTPAFDGSVERLPAGGYVCRILKAWLETTMSGSEQLCIALEIIEGKYNGFFKKSFDSKKSNNANATWPCIFRQFVADMDGNANPFFKGMIKSIEESNAGYAWNWNEATLANKMIGMIFREEEFEANDGTIKTTVRPAFPRSVQRIRNGVETPEIRRLNKSSNNNNGMQNAGFTPVEDDKLPWEV